MISKLFVMFVNTISTVYYVSSAIVQVFNLTSCAACPGGCGMNVLLSFFVILKLKYLESYQYQWSACAAKSGKASALQTTASPKFHV